MKINMAVEALAALAQESRLQIFRLLVQTGPEGMSAGRIGDQLGLSPPTLSFHLATLRHAGLIESRRRGRHLIYTARFRVISELMSFLMENCCQGHPEACAFLSTSTGTAQHRGVKKPKRVKHA